MDAKNVSSQSRLVCTIAICVFALSGLLPTTQVLAGDYSAEITGMWLSPQNSDESINPDLGDSFAVNANVHNTSPSSGPYGGKATFDVHVKVTRPDSTIANDYTFDQIEHLLDQTIHYKRGAVQPITANQEGEWRIDWEVWNPYYYGQNYDPPNAVMWTSGTLIQYVYKPRSGDIISAGPSDFTGFTTRTVSVQVKNTGRDIDEMVVKCTSLPSGWSVSPTSKSLPLNYNETDYFTFSVTSPNNESSGTITWQLYDHDSDPDFLLDTYDQSVTKTFSPGGSITSASPSDFTGYTTRTVTVNVNNSGTSGTLVVEASSLPTGWSIDQTSKSIYMAYNTSTGFTFDVTSLDYDSTDTIIWHLHSGSTSGTQLHSYNQEVTKIVPETVSPSGTPTIASPAPYRAGSPITFSASGSVDNKGYPVEYQFYSNTGDSSGWGQNTMTWQYPGTYYIYVNARSTHDTSVVSINSGTLEFVVQDSQPIDGSPPNVDKPALVAPGSHLEVFNGQRFQNVNPATGLFEYDGIDAGRTGQQAFDYSKPTVILVHGWRPNNKNSDDTIVDARLTDWVRWSCVSDDGAIQGLGHRSWFNSTSPDALNIAAWNWVKNASTGNWYRYDAPTNDLYVELNVPYDKVSTEASSLATAIKQLFSEHQQNRLHFVGSSLGAGVTVRTANTLTQSNANLAIDQVTTFDAPEWFSQAWETDVISNMGLLAINILNIDIPNISKYTHYQGLSLDEEIKELTKHGVWIDNCRSQFGKTYDGIFNIDFDYGTDPPGNLIEDHYFALDWYFPTFGTLLGTINIADGEISKDVGAAWSKVINSVDAEQSIIDMRYVLTYGPDIEKKNGRTFVIDWQLPEPYDPYSLKPHPDELLLSQKSYTNPTDLPFSNSLPNFDPWYHSGDVYFENGRVIMYTGSPVYLYREITLEPTARSISFLFKMNNQLPGDKFSVFFNNEPLWIFDGAAFPANEQGFINSGLIPVTKFAGQSGRLTFVYDSGQTGKICEIFRLQIENEVAPEGGYKLNNIIPDIDSSWFFNAPSAVAVDSAGNVYVADSGNNQIKKFTSDGAFITKWGSYGSGNEQFNSPQGVAVDSTGNVYVTDVGNNRIQKFTVDGVFVSTWGSYGSGDGQFASPKGVAVDSTGNVYVTDVGNNRIQKFTANGVFVTTWGSYGSGNEQFNSPQGIAVDSTGNVYVADYWNYRIQKFTSDGVFVTTWVSQGTHGGHFYRPGAVAVDSFGYVYVSYPNTQHIQVFTLDGDFLYKWGGEPGNSESGVRFGIAVDPDGNVYVADSGDYRIHKFTSNGNFITIWGSYSSENGQFIYPAGVAVGSAGNMYIADALNNRIQKFTKDGVFVATWGSYGSENGQFMSPTGVAVDTDGNVYVTELDNNRIQKFTADGVFITTWGSSGSGDGLFDLPCGVTVDSDGNVYVTDFGNNRIQKFTKDGVFVATWGSYGSGDGQFHYPSDVAVDSAGNVYVADSENHRIQKFTSDGVFVTTWGSSDLENGKVFDAYGVAVDSSGNVYVVDLSNNQIKKFTSDGAFITKWGSYGSGNEQFFWPCDIAVDLTGNVYVADSCNNRIQKFSPVGFDLNGSGMVDYIDIARLADRWLWSGEPGGIQEDIVKDGIVNFADFSLIAQHWLKGVEQ
jgi:DNA-binding beta-propeller fold protein YncE/pimeloyl-ACP methyl ester carboxylesterase